MSSKNYEIRISYINMNSFGKNLKELRKENNLWQSDLAKKLSVTDATISRWELGKQEPDFDMLIKVAKYFNVSTDYLLGLED